MTSNKTNPKAAKQPAPLPAERLDQVSGGLTINKRVYYEPIDRFKDQDPNPPVGLQYDANPQNY